jgi:hypothetical protein
MNPDSLRQAIRAKYVRMNPDLFYEDMSDADFAQNLHYLYDQSRGAWPSEEERTAARQRWLDENAAGADANDYMAMAKESRYLLDPDTREFQPILADARLMEKWAPYSEADRLLRQSIADGDPEDNPEAYAYAAANALEARYALQKTADEWEQVRTSPLAHPEDRELFDRMVDPESDAGWFLSRAGIIPNAYRYKLGGESPQEESDAALGPVASYLAGKMGYGAKLLPSSRAVVDSASNVSAAEARRPYTATPVLTDFSGDRNNLGDVRGERIRQLTQQSQSEPPMARERWIKTTGFNPPDWLAFASDVAVDYIDPSAVADFAGPLASAVKSAARVGGRAGMKGLARSAAMEVAPDVGVEVGFGAALSGGDPTYEGGSLIKSDKELAESKDARRQNEYVRLHPSREQFYNNAIAEAYRRPTKVRGLLGGIRN